MAEIISGCAVRAVRQLEKALKNCRVCGLAPHVEFLPDDGLRVSCANLEPVPHRMAVESEPSNYAIDTWNALQGGA